MRKNLLYFLIIAGIVLFVGNIWSADFDTSKINYWSMVSSISIVILGFIELNKKKKNEN